MTKTVESAIREALSAHSYAGRVEGPGYVAVMCRCRVEFPPAEHAHHQADQVVTAVRAVLTAARERLTAAEAALVRGLPEGTDPTPYEQEVTDAYDAFREIWPC